MPLLKLLLVEDEPAHLTLMTELLRQLKADVLPVGDSQYAVQLIDREKFDGIFLDLTMPGLSDYDLARRVREAPDNQDPRFVVVIGRDEPTANVKDLTLPRRCRRPGSKLGFTSPGQSPKR